MKITEYLAGLTIGTEEVPITEIHGMKPFGKINDRWEITLTLVIRDGSKLTIEKKDA